MCGLNRYLIAAVVAPLSVAGCGTGAPSGGTAQGSTPGALTFSLGQAKNRPQSLGQFKRGERREFSIRLENRTGGPLQWETVRMSCECLELRLPARHLDADGRMDGTVILDLGHTPDFRGGLMLTAEAVPAGGGPPVFTLELLADVE